MRRKRILLADDSRTALMVEQMILSASGYDVVVARDGEEAVSLAADAAADLIVLDIVMPRADGIEACRRLRQMDATSGTPIIMVTTRAEVQNMEDAYQAGCNDYVIKPVKGPELLSKVRDLIGV